MCVGEIMELQLIYSNYLIQDTSANVLSQKK